MLDLRELGYYDAYYFRWPKDTTMTSKTAVACGETSLCHTKIMTFPNQHDVLLILEL